MAAFIHRTTLAFHATGSTPKHPVEDWIRNPDLSALGAVDRKYWKIDVDDVLEMTQGEKDAVDAALLPSVKADRKGEVDAKTVGLIGGGFTHEAEQFSLSAEAQRDWLAVKTEGAAAGFAYPYPQPTLDNSYYTAEDEAEMIVIAGKARDRVAALVSGGATLKKQIEDAADEAAVDAIADDRT